MSTTTRPKVSATLTVTLAALGGLVSGAAADTQYAGRGVVELGGSARLSFTSESVTRDTIDQSSDSSVTDVQLQPIIGYFVAPQLQIFGGPVVGWSRNSRDDGPSATTTRYGAAAGAGYYFPAGPVFFGPRAEVGYARSTLEFYGDQVTGHTWSVLGSGALRVPLGFGGVVDVAAVLGYLKGSTTISQSSGSEQEEGSSEFNVGVAVGFFVFF